MFDFQNPGTSIRAESAVKHGIDALLAASGSAAPDPRNPLIGARFGSVAAALANACSIDRKHTASPSAMYAAATSGVFPEYLEVLRGAAERQLRNAYENASRPYSAFTRERLRPTLRARATKRAKPFDLTLVPEGLSLSIATVASEDTDIQDAKTHIALVRIPRQQVLNDDIQFLDVIDEVGRAAARSLSKSIIDVLISNPTLADTGQLFNSNALSVAGGHANYLALGYAPTAASISVAKAAIRKQPTKVGGDPLGLRPRFLIAPAALEDVAWAALGTNVAMAEPGSGQERALLDAGRMSLIVAPELDSNSATGWYVAADPEQAALVEVDFIGSTMAPQLSAIRNNFDLDCLEVAVRFEFAVSPGNWRAGYYTLGTGGS
jgi:hypothetical protein